MNPEPGACRCYHVAMSDFSRILNAKRLGGSLTAEEILQLVEGVTSGVLTDAQLGAFTMAVCYQGMTSEEQVALTLAMRDSGTTLQWDDIDGPLVDKHSTGGIGDMVSLILGPMLAACGAYIPMISGRGLGHTGGTLDKLESIPGFDAFPGLEQFSSLVRDNGVSIIGQTDQLAPADRRIYATRDETSTVPAVPLIVSSILSKKFAEGLDGLVLDVKTGNGAFMREMSEARELAGQLVTVSEQAGLPCSALITDMSQPLAWSAGNILEVKEVIEFLDGNPNPRLLEVVLALGAAALQRVGLAGHQDEAMGACTAALESGKAADHFARMVASQGGPVGLLERADEHLAAAPVVEPLLASRSGWVSGFDTRGVGLVVMYLGGGRQHVSDKIDPRVGLSGLCSVGDRVEQGQPLAYIHAASKDDCQAAATSLAQAITIGPNAVSPLPCVYEQIG